MTVNPSSGLAEERVRALRRLSIFRDSFSLDAATAVWESVGDNEETLLQMLGVFRDEGSLELVAAASGSPPVYRLNESDRLVGRHRLSESDEAISVQHAYAEHFVSLVERFAASTESDRSSIESKAIERGHADLGPALSWMLEFGDTERALNAAWALVPFWREHSLVEGRRLVEALFAAPCLLVAGNSRAVALDLAGTLAYYAEDFSGARHWYEQSLAASRVSGQTPHVARLLQELARVCVLISDNEGARQYCEELLRGFDE